MKQNRSEGNSSKRFRFEDETQENVTSGQVGPKSKKRISKSKSLPFPEPPDTSSPVRDASGTSGQHDPKYQNSKYRQHSEQTRPSDHLRHEGEPPPGGDGGPASDGGGASSDKKAVRNDRQFEKSKFRAEKAGAKLNDAREKAAAQKPPSKPSMAKTAVKKAAAGAWYYAHQKIHEVEQENVGVEAAHQMELTGEKAVRGASRFVKHRIRTRPTRRVAKWERRDIRAKANFEYLRMAREHPELKNSTFSRFLQKQRIKKQYQKQARQAAKRGVKATEKTAAATGKITRAAAAFVKRHPAGLLME